MHVEKNFFRWHYDKFSESKQEKFKFFKVRSALIEKSYCDDIHSPYNNIGEFANDLVDVIKKAVICSLYTIAYAPATLLHLLYFTAYCATAGGLSIKEWKLLDGSIYTMFEHFLNQVYMTASIVIEPLITILTIISKLFHGLLINEPEIPPAIAP